ncbi:MAG: hypothetical protein K0U24_06390 [Gammaproteobacteria bacterium]|nr:hypothetical protein [Gammaproteobacteria bacterium]MCH9763833.1 hypothetical protein [Gammaproteobacteria bacterium]
MQKEKTLDGIMLRETIATADKLNRQVQEGNLNALLTFVKGKNEERKFLGMLPMGASLAEGYLMNDLSQHIHKRVSSEHP